MIAIAINLGRDNAIDCGCFDVSAANKTHEERIRDMWIVLIRDAGMLLMVARWPGRNGCIARAAPHPGASSTLGHSVTRLRVYARRDDFMARDSTSGYSPQRAQRTQRGCGGSSFSELQ